MQTGALITAAGMSSRMGSFKPILPIHGSPMVRYIAGKMEAAGADHIVVVTGYGHEKVKAALEGTRVKIVHNPGYAHTQMIDSIRLGVRALAKECDQILFAPVDCPLFKAETAWAMTRMEGDFVVPMYKDQPGHPVLMREHAISAVLAGRCDGGLRELMRSNGLTVLRHPFDDDGILADADTKEQYLHLLKKSQEQPK